MSKTSSLFCTLPVIWAVLSFPFVNGSLITSNAGNCSSYEFWYKPMRDCVPLHKRSSDGTPPYDILFLDGGEQKTDGHRSSYGIACPLEGHWYWSNGTRVTRVAKRLLLNLWTELSACLPASPVAALSPSDLVPCPSHYAWDTATSRCIQVEHVQRSAACGTTEFW